MKQGDATTGARRQKLPVRQKGAQLKASAARKVHAEKRRVHKLYRLHFRDMRREKLFLSSMAFFCTFGMTRGVTHAIRSGRGPFHNMTPGGLHIHHLVYGISLLLGEGYLNLWNTHLPAGSYRGRRRMSRQAKVTSVMYGAGAALTLDEFALWLNLADVYWSEKGRESIDAVVLFGAALSVGVWGGPFLRAVAAELVRVSGYEIPRSRPVNHATDLAASLDSFRR